MTLRPGESAELLAVREVESQGFHIVGRRIRFGPLEADILARREDVLVVVEVRSRRQGGWIHALDSCTATKLRALRRLRDRVWAAYSSDSTLRVVRVDLIAIEWTPQGHEMCWTRGVV